MKLHNYWKHFLSEVNLNQSRIDTLDDRVTSITSFLQGANGFGNVAEEVVAQGSYAQKTIIRPIGTHEFDADVLLRMTHQATWAASDYVQNLYDRFRANSTYREMVSRQSRCVLINYANDFHVDVVPYIVQGDLSWITNRPADEYEQTNPEGFNQWLDERDRIATRRLVEVIRVMKYLRDYKQTFTVRSVVLSYLLATQVNSVKVLLQPKCYGDLPTAFVTLIEDLTSWLWQRPELPFLQDPSCTAQNFHDRWNAEHYKNFRTKMQGYAQKARAAYDSDTADESLRLWQELFGSAKFRLPPVTKTLTLSESSALQVRDYEQDITRDLGFPMDRSGGHTVTLVGRVRKKEGMDVYPLSRRGNRVAKWRSIAFEATTSVPAPYDLYWKVRNGGAEAARADCLRGEIELGNSYRSEPTAYRGDHYVEVYVVKDRLCVAATRQRVKVF